MRESNLQDIASLIRHCRFKPPSFDVVEERKRKWLNE